MSTEMTIERKLTLAAMVLGGAAGAVALAARAARGLRSLNFRDRVIVITGGSRGLGLIMARQLADEGARLTLLARDDEELLQAERDVVGRGGAVRIVRCDVTEQSAFQKAIDDVVAAEGRLDVLVNNAGIIQVGPFDHMTIDDYERAMRIHFWAPLYGMLAAIPQMREQGEGRIVNIASIAGKIAVPHLAPYVASKFALVGLSDVFRAELAPDGIRVTTVCPGLMRTGSALNAWMKGQHEAEFRWFALLSAMPLIAIDAERAARQIIEACRRGDPELVVTPQARLAVVASALAPDRQAQLMALAARVLPRPAPERGTEARRGADSRTPLTHSFATKLMDRAAVENNEIRSDV